MTRSRDDARTASIENRDERSAFSPWQPRSAKSSIRQAGEGEGEGERERERERPVASLIHLSVISRLLEREKEGEGWGEEEEEVEELREGGLGRGGFITL